MRAVIKSGGRTEPGLVRSHRAPPPADIVPLPDEAELLRARIAQLEGEVARQLAAAGECEERISASFEQGRRQGREQGMAEAATREAERLEATRAAASKGIAAFEARLDEAEALAVLLARSCLETLFGTGERRIDLVRDLIRARMARLSGETLVVLKLSPADFPDEAAITSVLAETGIDRARIVVDRSLGPGDIVFGLGLGEVEFGIGQQWGSLRQLMDDWLAAGARP